MMDISIGSPASSYRSRSSRSSGDCAQRPGLARDAGGSSDSGAAGQTTGLLTDAAGLGDANDGDGRRHSRRRLEDSCGCFEGSRSGLEPTAAGEDRCPPSLGWGGEAACRPPPPNASVAPAPQRQGTDVLVDALSNCESMRPARRTPSSIPLCAPLPSSSSPVTGGGGAVHLASRHARPLLPGDRLHSRVEGMASLCTAAGHGQASAAIPPLSAAASRAAGERGCTDDAVGARAPRAAPLEADARASAPAAVATAAPATRSPERQQANSRTFVHTESLSPLRRAEHTVRAPRNTERDVAAEAPPDAEVLGACCGPLGMLALELLPGGGGQEVLGNRPRAERALQLARVSHTTATLASPPALSPTPTSAEPLPRPPPLSSASTAAAPERQPRLRVPSQPLESANSASPSRPVAWRGACSRASATTATPSDSYDRGESCRRHYSRRHGSDSRHRAVGGVEDGDSARSSSPGLTETNGARPPSQAPAPRHPPSFSLLTTRHACHRLPSSSGSAEGGRPGEAQRADETRQPLDSSQTSSPAPSPLASRSPSARAPPSVPPPPQRSVEETRGGSSSDKGEGGTGPAMTELAEWRPPLATPGERAVSCGGSDGATAIAGESPPPLPLAPWRAGDGASSLDPGRCGSHPHSKSRATDAHGVARQPSASDPDVASETRAGDREVWTSRECHESPAAVSLRDGAAAALGVDGAHRGVASSADRSAHTQTWPAQGRALDRWRSHASLVGGAAAETAALSSSSAAVTPSPQRPATKLLAECDDGHPPQSRRGDGRTAKSPLKGGVDAVRWVLSSAGAEDDLSEASLAPPSVRKASGARTRAPPTSLRSASTTGISGTAGSASPRVVASAGLAETTQSWASAVHVPGARRASAQACQRVAALSSSRSRVRLTVITSPAPERRGNRAEREFDVGGAVQVGPRGRCSGARWRAEGSTGEGFRARNGGARGFGIAAVLQGVHPLRSSSSGPHASHPGLAAVLAPRAVVMCRPGSSAEVDGADGGEETGAVARTWRPATSLGFVCDGVRRRSPRDDCRSAAAAQRLRHPRALQKPAAAAGALCARPDAQPAGHSHGDSHDHVLPMESSPLVSVVSLAVEAASRVCASAHRARSAATRWAGVASNGVGGGLLPSSALAPGYAAVYSPRMLATAVLEAREALLGTAGAAAVATAAGACPSGPPTALLPPHCGSRAMPAVGATVAAVASTSGCVSSRSLSSLRSPPHLRVDLTERSADVCAMPASATADAAPWSLYLSGSPDAGEPMRHRAAPLQQPLHRQQDLPVDTFPCPVARRIPFGFATGTLAGAVSPPHDGRVPSCRPPAEEQRCTTASEHSNPTVARAAAPATAASTAPRATSASPAQARHGGILSPEHHAAGARARARERVVWASAGRSGAGAKDADHRHDARVSRQVRQSHTLAQQRLIQEEAFRRRYISMQEDHQFAIEVTELNYQRAVEYAHQASTAGAAAAPDRRSGHSASPVTADCDAEPLVGLQRVRRDQAAMTATLSTLARELAVLSLQGSTTLGNT
nr:unnamed protein product [Leishmania braziliensis]